MREIVMKGIIRILLFFVFSIYAVEIEILNQGSQPRKNEYEISFGERTLLSNKGYTNHFDPRICLFQKDSKTHLSTVWVTNEQDGDYLGIFSAIVNGTNNIVRSNFQVNTEWLRTQNQPSVSSFNQQKNFIYTWTMKTENIFPSNYHIKGQIHDSESLERVGGEFTIHNSSTGRTQSFSTIGTFSDGGFVVVWHSEDDISSRSNIVARFFDSAGNFDGDDIYLTKTYLPFNDFKPELCVFPDDNFILTFERTETVGYEPLIIYRKFDRRGQPIGDEVIYNQELFFDSGGCAILENNRFVVSSKLFGSEWRLSFYQNNGFPSQDELIRTIATNMLSASPSLTSSKNGQLLIHLAGFNLFLLNSEGDLISPVIDFTENLEYVISSDAVFIDDNTAIITWQFDNNNITYIFSRTVYFKPLY